MVEAIKICLNMGRTFDGGCWFLSILVGFLSVLPSIGGKFGKFL